MQINTQFIDQLVSQAEEANKEGDFKYAISCYQLAVNSYRKVCVPEDALDWLNSNQDERFTLPYERNVFDLDEELHIDIPPTAESGTMAPHTEWIQHNRDTGKIIILKEQVARALGKHFKTAMKEAKRGLPHKIGKTVMIRTEEAKIWEIALKRCEQANATTDPNKITIKLGF